MLLLSPPVCYVQDGLFDIATSLINEKDCEKIVFQYPTNTMSLKGRTRLDGNIELEIDDTVIVCSLERFVRQLLNIYESYEYDYHEKEHESRQRHTLPRRRIEQLQQLFKTRRQNQTHDVK
jgi:hypothetical protein